MLIEDAPVDKFGRKLPAKTGKYYLPRLTVDAVLFHNSKILLIRRGRDPFQGYLALPGGFVDYNEEPSESCTRELMEECTVDGKIVKLVGVYGKPLRDPRHHTVSMAYLVKANKLNDKGEVDFKHADDAADAGFWDVEELLKEGSGNTLAFDHIDIIRKGNFHFFIFLFVLSLIHYFFYISYSPIFDFFCLSFYL